MGPFYCPNDRKIYLDTSFFRELETRFRGCSGKACQFAQAYVIAHEVGHHVQNQLGILPKVQQAQRASGDRARSRTASRCRSSCRPTASPASGPTTPRRNSKFIEPGDVEAALQTAAAIGDDTLQRQAQGTWCRTASPTARRSSASAGSRPASRRAPSKACNTFAAATAIIASHARHRRQATVRAAQDRGADGVRHPRARRRQVGRDAGRADREGRPRGGGARDRHRRRRENPRAGAGMDRRRRSTSSSRPAAPASPAAM